MKRLITLTILLLTLSVGAAWGIHGSSLWFDGVDDSVSCGNPSNLNFTDKFTIEAWIYPTTNSSSYTGIVTKYQTAPSSGYDVGVNNAYTRLTLRGTTALNNTNSINVPVNKWSYICAIGTTDSISMYTNGVLNSTVLGLWAPVTATNVLVVGKRNQAGVGNESFNGNIDEVRIYHRVLTPTEIAWNYRHPDQPYSRDSLKLWLQMNEYTGTTTADSSGNGNNGTISGATWNIETPVWAGSCYKP